MGGGGGGSKFVMHCYPILDFLKCCGSWGHEAGCSMHQWLGGTCEGSCAWCSVVVGPCVAMQLGAAPFYCNFFVVLVSYC